jgi:hypothetical protein
MCAGWCGRRIHVNTEGTGSLKHWWRRKKLRLSVTQRTTVLRVNAVLALYHWSP